MILFKRASDLAGWLDGQRNSGRSIGFVPTMGALHAGHISLIDISKKQAEVTVCSIFINPTQFNDPKDFQKYPVTIEKDIALLEKAGADVLFLPEVGEMYPSGTAGLERYELGRLETILEGQYRPGHFQGVCQIVRRLLDMVRPDELFMGSKDYQQCMVVQRLIILQGMKTRLNRCPIVREEDGLAMSSRNVRLPAEDRVKATTIYRALTGVKEGWKGAGPHADGAAGEVVGAAAGNGPVGAPGSEVQQLVQELTGNARQLLEEAGFRVDYVEIADAETLEPLAGNASGAITGRSPEGHRGAVALVAAFLGEVRLIDNMVL